MVAAMPAGQVRTEEWPGDAGIHAAGQMPCIIW